MRIPHTRFVSPHLTIPHRHYVFIENQYFISSTVADELIPRNKIALALLDRYYRPL